MILSARICGYNADYAKTFSSIFEYLHAATLLHDDLVDGGAVRRGKPAAHFIWGNPTTVLVGDFLLARSLSIAAETGRSRIIKVIAEITENMSQGEIQQLMRKGHLDLSEAEYMEVIRRKTSVLIQGACRAGAMIADAPPEAETALADYGFNLGLAFQLADDLLDYTADAKLLGKEIGTDLKEGKLTLPVIHTLKEADAQDRRLMEKIITNQEFSVPEFQILLEFLDKYGGIDYTRRMATEHITIAKEALSVFKYSETKEILLDVADFALAREV
jgi:octaprenyl-diphosphate synthase